MGGSYYPIPCSILSIGKDHKTPQRYPNVPITSWRISIRSMDSFQGLALKSPSSWHRSLASNSNFLRSYEVSLNYENPDIEQLLGIMERKVNTLMKDAISLMGESESIFRLTTNEMYRPPSKPSRQEEFEHIVMNFILDQEERVGQLEDYMRAIVEEFMEFSLEVARRLKERIKENENKPGKIQKITKYPDTKVLENKRDLLENLEMKTFPTSTNPLCVRHVRIIPLNLPQPRKNTFGFKLGERTNQSYHIPSNPLAIQQPTQNDTTFMVNDPIKCDPSPHCSFTHIVSNRMFDPGGKTHNLSFKGSHGLQF
ncbi:hypothetical protein Tco_0486808 [Tanacetum coccineum]